MKINIWLVHQGLPIWLIFEKIVHFEQKSQFFLFFLIKKNILLNQIISNENISLINQVKLLIEGLWNQNLQNLGVLYIIEIKRSGFDKPQCLILWAKYLFETSKTSCRLRISWYLTFKVNFRCYKLLISYIFGPMGTNCPQIDQTKLSDGDKSRHRILGAKHLFQTLKT